MRGRAIVAGLLLAAPLHSGSAAGAAPLGAQDTAAPVYLSSTTATAGENEFECPGARCTMVLKTKTDAYPCTTELVTLPGGFTPALLYQNTFCSVSITGTLKAELDQSGPCVLHGTQAMRVSFSSGANSAFNGVFPATATFKPTAVTTNGYVTRARVTMKGGGSLSGNPTANGAIAATFEVAFSGPGLSPYCYAATARGLTTTASGTVATRF